MPIKTENFGRNSQSGAVAIIVALSLPVLIGMAGLALDLGKLYVTKTELQNAADACALAAAVELDGTVSQFTLAESRGIAVGKLNRSFFQTPEKEEVTSVERIVKFSTSLNGSYQKISEVAGPPANYKFVQCTATRNGIPNYLIPVLNILTPTQDVDNSISTVSSVAVASNRPGQATCALPIGICSANVSSTTPVGTWLEGTLSGGSGISGSYKWVDFSAPNGGQKELAGILNGSIGKDCNLNPVGQDVEQMGAINSLEFHYNTRFGIEKKGEGGVTGIPDYSGYSYYSTNWPSKFGAYENYAVKSKDHIQFQGEALSGIKLNGNPEILTTEQLKKRGADRRVAVAPVIDCSLFGPGNPPIAVQRYVCLFLLHPIAGGGNGGGPAEPKGSNKNPPAEVPEPKMYLEYLGDAKNAGPCNQIGLAGASNGIGPGVSALVQ